MPRATAELPRIPALDSLVRYGRDVDLHVTPLAPTQATFRMDGQEADARVAVHTVRVEDGELLLFLSVGTTQRKVHTTVAVDLARVDLARALAAEDEKRLRQRATQKDAS
jgi:hypothetical protein